MDNVREELRFGFIEAGAWWVPYILSNLKRRDEKIAKDNSRSFAEFEASGNVLSANRLHVTCQVDEDWPYLLDVLGENSLMIGSDYSHSDASREKGCIHVRGKRTTAGQISKQAEGVLRTVSGVLVDHCSSAHKCS